MSHFNRLHAITAASILALAASTAFANAADRAEFPTSIIPTNSPVVLTNCSSRPDAANPDFADNAMNRSNMFLMSYVVRWTVYDHAGVQMGQGDREYYRKDDLAPGDITTDESYGFVHLTEPLSAFARATCRMQSAKFEGGKTWTYGRPWKGKLSPMPTATPAE